MTPNVSKSKIYVCGAICASIVAVMILITVLLLTKPSVIAKPQKVTGPKVKVFFQQKGLNDV